MKSQFKFRFLAILLSMTYLTSLRAHLEFQYDPPENFSLFLGKGTVSHPVSTLNPEAQRYFDQGLTLIWAFNHDASYWSFKRASEIDPNLAMAYWGMALALGKNINTPITPDRESKAYELVQQALKLSPNATENEKAYIHALAARYTNNPQADLVQLDKDYADELKKLVIRYPDDLDAATLYAESLMDLNPWKLWDSNRNPRKGTLEIVELLESVIRRNPNHLGANHYYIHAVEASNHPEWGLMSAERIRTMLPKSGHILHMPSHIYVLVGDYQQAALSNEEAAAIDRAYIREFGIGGSYPIHYLGHVLYFLSRNYDSLGRFEDAMSAAKELISLYSPFYHTFPEVEFYLSAPILISMHFHQWQEILNYPPPDPQKLLTTAIWHFARAMAAASQGNLTLAKEEQKFFLQSKKKLPSNSLYGYNPSESILMIADLSLKSKLAEKSQDFGSAIGFLQQAITLQDKLQYNEPPDWYIDIREILGGLYLRNQQYQNAEKIFREELRRYPRTGRSLFGLLQSLRGQFRHMDAWWIQQEFDKAWKYSTTPLCLDDL